MGNSVSITLSILEVGGYICLLNWAFSLRLPRGTPKSVVSLISEMRRAALIAGGFAISLCIPFSLNMLVLLQYPSLSLDKMGFGLSVMGLSFYNLSCYRLASGNVSPDALLLSGIIGIYGARMALHHGYKLWTQNHMEISYESYNYPHTILTGSDSQFKELSFETRLVGRALACLVRTIFLGVSNLLPYLSVVYSNPSIAFTPIPGLVLLLAGTAISAVSEWQKEQQEILDPDSLCTTGIFRFSRYPESGAQILYHSGIVLTCYSQAPYTPLIFLSSLPHFFGILGIIISIKKKDSSLQLTQVTNQSHNISKDTSCIEDLPNSIPK